MAKKKKKLTDAESEELDGYLQNTSNYKIYERLKGESYDYDADYNRVYEVWCKDLFQPLEFFRLFNQQTAFIEQNKEKPLLVARTLRDLKLSDLQFYFLYENLLEYFAEKRKKDEKIDVCCREIYKHKETLDVYDEEDEDEENEDETEKEKPKDAFEEVLEHLETLPTHKEQIAYLIQQQTTYEQNSGLEWTGSGEKTFGEKCQLEINKREKLMKLEENQTASKDCIKKHKDLTIDRAILLMKSLAPRLTGCDQNKVADVIAFLTGFESESIRINFSEIKNKFANKPEAYNKDVKIVCEFLNLIGLTNEVEKIKKDSGVT